MTYPGAAALVPLRPIALLTLNLQWENANLAEHRLLFPYPSISELAYVFFRHNPGPPASSKASSAAVC
jgi:hypothetical protein